MQRKTIFSLFCIVLLPLYTMRAPAQTTSLTVNCVASTKDCYISTDGSHTYKTFEVEVLEEDDYFASIWSCPTLYGTGNYAPMSVLVNGEAATEITFTKGNWQSTFLNSGRSIHLKKGTNTIAFSCKAPTIPCVESLCLSSDMQNAEISDTKYSEYLEKAKSGQQEEYPCLLSKSLSTKGLAASQTYIRENVPLKYSFHTTCYFKQNQEVSFATSANVHHAVDIFYYGSNAEIDFSLPTNGRLVSSTAATKTANGFPATTIPHKLNMLYTPATSDEIQGLNWKRISQRSTTAGGKNESELTVTFQKEGFYMVKLRSLENGVLGVADLSIDDQTFKDVPVYYSYVDCTMPADSMPYTAAALRTTETLSDPMLFVEGNDGLRIVGYSDDNGGTILGQQVYREAIIRQCYNIDTQRLHVCNYSSENPEGTCEIIGGISDEENKAAESSDMGITTKGADKFHNRPTVPTSVISKSLSQEENGIEVGVYDVTGKKIGTITTSRTLQDVTSADLHTYAPGVYILRSTTENGTTQKKLIVQ